MSEFPGQTPPAGYDVLAEEYYSSKHITSRNFDAATFAYLRNNPISLPDGLALDLGAGKGRLGEYCGVPSSRIIQVDISAKMLRLPDRELVLGRVQADALLLPFKSNTFAIVAAFLFDPFNENGLFAEIARVLSIGGMFVGTIPDFEWGQVLRSGKRKSTDEAVFVLNSGESVARPSMLSRPEELADSLAAAGLATVMTAALKLPRETVDVSPDIEMPARIMGKSSYSIPIVQLVIARRI